MLHFGFEEQSSPLLYKAKMQYLLTCKVLYYNKSNWIDRMYKQGHEDGMTGYRDVLDESALSSVLSMCKKK